MQESAFFTHTKYLTHIFTMLDLQHAMGFAPRVEYNSATAKLAALHTYEGPVELMPPSLREFDKSEAARAYREIMEAPGIAAEYGQTGHAEHGD